MVSIDVLARDGSSEIAALLGYRRFEGSWPESRTPAPFGAGFVRSGGPHRVEEFADLELEAVAVAGQCRGENLRRGRSGFAGAALHVGDVRRDLLRALSRLLHVAGNLMGRRTLLFHGGCDGR